MSQVTQKLTRSILIQLCQDNGFSLGVAKSMVDEYNVSHLSTYSESDTTTPSVGINTTIKIALEKESAVNNLHHAVDERLPINTRMIEKALKLVLSNRLAEHVMYSYINTMKADIIYAIEQEEKTSPVVTNKSFLSRLFN